MDITMHNLENNHEELKYKWYKQMTSDIEKIKEENQVGFSARRASPRGRGTREPPVVAKQWIQLFTNSKKSLLFVLQKKYAEIEVKVLATPRWPPTPI
jgi:hypothetical protein